MYVGRAEYVLRRIHSTKNGWTLWNISTEKREKANKLKLVAQRKVAFVF